MRFSAVVFKINLKKNTGVLGTISKIFVTKVSNFLRGFLKTFRRLFQEFVPHAHEAKAGKKPPLKI